MSPKVSMLRCDSCEVMFSVGPDRHLKDTGIDDLKWSIVTVDERTEHGAKEPSEHYLCPNCTKRVEDAIWNPPKERMPYMAGRFGP